VIPQVSIRGLNMSKSSSSPLSGQLQIDSEFADARPKRMGVDLENGGSPIRPLDAPSRSRQRGLDVPNHGGVQAWK
jgi:hypothetical protein